MPAPEMVERQRLVRVARGLETADLVVRNARIADVFTLELIEGDVAIAGGRIAGIGHYPRALNEIDASGGVLSPGLIDAHIHLESSLMTPRRFAEAVLPRGTTGVVAEPHELVNVVGPSGLAWTLEAGRASAMRVWASVPSCVPASPYEASGASVQAADVRAGLALEGVLGLAEMMNYPGVLEGDPLPWSILGASDGRRRDGHASGLSGRDLSAYAAAGIHSDHEMTSAAEALERLRAGMWLMVREGSAARNLAAVAPILKQYRPHRAMLVSDDVDAGDILERGHLDRILREAVANGIPPLLALRMVTLAPAEYWRLDGHGAVAPGHVADLVLFDDLAEWRIRWTMVAGEVVARDGATLHTSQKSPALAGGAVTLPASWGGADLRAQPQPGPIPAIGVDPRQIRTTALTVELPRDAGGHPLPFPERDVAKLAVIERHSGSGRTGVGFVQGSGIRRGALGQTVLHDAHNLVVAGTSDDDMALAARELARMGGGAVVVLDGEVLARLHLPIAGLVSDAPGSEILQEQRAVEAAAKRLGCSLPHPLMTLSFLGLTVIPSLKLTDRGLFDVDSFSLLEPGPVEA